MKTTAFLFLILLVGLGLTNLDAHPIVAVVLLALAASWSLVLSARFIDSAR